MLCDIVEMLFDMGKLLFEMVKRCVIRLKPVLRRTKCWVRWPNVYKMGKMLLEIGKCMKIVPLAERPNIIIMCCRSIEEDLYLLVHNIDGPMLRNDKAQSALAELAHHPKVNIHP